jgi:PAS domain-containing protein
MSVLGRIGDVLTLITFCTAFGVLLWHALRSPRHDQTTAEWLLVAALGIYVIIAISDTLIWAQVTTAFEGYDDHLESLFPVLALGVVFAAYSAQQYADAVRAQRGLAQAHELMMDIVDGAPAGILFLGPTGATVFANDAAKHVLDLEEDDATGAITGPGWVEEGLADARPGELPSLVRDEPYEGMPVTVKWPNGWAVDLRVSGRPLSDATGDVGGVVVSFEKPRMLYPG